MPGAPRHPGGFAWNRRAAGAVLAGVVALSGLAAAPPAMLAAVTYDPATDLYSMAATTSNTGAAAWWNAGYTGAGVDVALIDTGVAPVEGLATAGKIIYGPDLSLESQAPSLRNLDTNGHGTFMAGLIAGKDSTLTAPYANAPASAYRGMAPDARILSLKVGVADGGTDVTQVIPAIDWVVQHRTDNGLNIRVINLSYGTNSLQASTVDPLSFAVEQAWKKGIVVVVAAGNTGYQKGRGALGIADPAYNSYVIGVGGYDSMGTSAARDDEMGAYSASSVGCGPCKNPDFVAVGSHLQGLRVPNGYIDATHPEGLLGTRYFRGSGTSEAAAITSGTIALILQKYPSLTPDQVKRFIADNGRLVQGTARNRQGGGEIDLPALATKTPARYTQEFKNGTGTGTIEAARGTDHLTLDDVVLTGEQDIFGEAVNTAGLAAAEAAGTSWSGGTWNGRSWSGDDWSGTSWSGRSWSGTSWSGRSWSGRSWSGGSWATGSWD
ncbi:MAG TPA: S8 family serine peptidase [Kineosporiaceae bacterium]|nr:S8 family serine peptidase [Kineosporiaceae bacterium]